MALGNGSGNCPLVDWLPLLNGWLALLTARWSITKTPIPQCQTVNYQTAALPDGYRTGRLSGELVP